MTNEEKQEIINAVLSAILTNSKTIEQLTPTESLSDDDAIEVSGGRRISYAAFLSAVQVGVQLMLDGYLTGESAVAWFAALENNPANYVDAPNNPVQLHWRQSPIVLLDSMGEDLDGDSSFSPQVGDKWWDPTNSTTKNYIFLKTSTGQDGWPIGSGNVNGVLYVNKRTGRMYLWDGTDMVEITFAGENDDNEGVGIVNIDNVDFAVGDAQGNIIVEFDEGHIKTSEFDSAQVKAQVAANSASVASINQQIAGIGGQSDVAVKNDDDAPFDISDAAGNVVLRVTSDGNLKTKGFNSANLDMFKSLKLGQPQCICHGYGSASGVANTLSYYRDGLAKGYKFFEVDAVNCSDGIPVCTHSAGSYEVYGKNDTTKTKVTVNFSTMTSTDVVNNYTWTPPTVVDGVITAYGEPIALLTDVIWLICFFHRYPLHVDGQGMTKASRLAASQYAESLGVGQYVFHEVAPYTDWTIPCNGIIGATSAASVANSVSLYKKADNILLFSMATSGPNALDPTDADDAATIQAICAAAKAAGCYTEIWTIYSSSTAKKWFELGVDFIITAGVTNDLI